MKNPRYRIYGIQYNTEKTIFGKWRGIRSAAEVDLHDVKKIFSNDWKWHVEKEEIV